MVWTALLGPRFTITLIVAAAANPDAMRRYAVAVVGGDAPAWMDSTDARSRADATRRPPRDDPIGARSVLAATPRDGAIVRPRGGTQQPLTGYHYSGTTVLERLVSKQSWSVGAARDRGGFNVSLPGCRRPRAENERSDASRRRRRFFS